MCMYEYMKKTILHKHENLKTFLQNKNVIIRALTGIQCISVLIFRHNTILLYYNYFYYLDKNIEATLRKGAL